MLAWAHSFLPVPDPNETGVMRMTSFSRLVQYYETDMMGIAHHANYIHWMEEARIDFLDQLGFPYTAMEAKGIVSPLKAISCEYKAPCSFGDRLDITLSVESFNGVVLALRYRMQKEQGDLVCEARSEHVFLTRDGRFVRMKREMPEFCEAIETFMKGNRSDE